MANKKTNTQEPKCGLWSDKKKLLGLDLGIASIGWCLFEEDEDETPKRIIDIGSFVFNQIEDKKSGKTENIARRQKRSMRRQRRRRVLRLADARKLFADELNVDFDNAIHSIEKGVTPFDIKVKGLHDELSKEELSVALYHYLKYRGYKSNRKNEKTGDESDKKVLGGIAQMKQQLKISAGAKYVTEILKENFDSQTDKSKKRYHNSSEEYFLTVSHDMYRDEINALLNRQISYGVINEAFKEHYLCLFDRRRDFSEGPGGNSPYKVNFAEVAGTCRFDGERRACKADYHAQEFILLSALNNLRFKTSLCDTYISLSPEQIRKVRDSVIFKTEVKYTAIFKAAGIMDVRRVKGLDMPRKKYADTLRKFAEKNGLPQGAPIPPEKNDDLDKFIRSELFGKTFYKGSELLKYLDKEYKNSGLDINEYLDQIDEISEILFLNKTDERIRKSCEEKGYTENLVNIVLGAPGADKTIDLSLILCKEINPELEKGNSYDVAMKNCGFNHSKADDHNYLKYLPPIDEAVEEIGVYLTNPVVRHTLVQMRRLINAIVSEYGAPTHYSVELARELKRNFTDRKEIQTTQEDNQWANNRLKTEMLEKFPDIFRSFSDINTKGGQGNNLLKYKLFKEQGGISPYSGKPIDERHLFDKNLYQIDHIAPYSRSFDDSFNNKVVVEAKENQDKRNMLPLEYFKTIGRDRNVLDHFLRTNRVSLAKKENLLRTEISDDFLNKDAEDNSYIAKLATQLIEHFMLPDGIACRTTSGAITSKLRILWGLSGKTHSYESSFENKYRADSVDSYLYSNCKILEGEKRGETVQIGVQFVFNHRGAETVFDVTKEDKPKGPTIDGKKQFNDAQKERNEAIECCIQNFSYFHEKFNLAQNKSITELQELLSGSLADENGEINEKFFLGLKVLADVYNQIQNNLNTKNRDNHLHHALDAAVIGVVTPKIKYNITKFFQGLENPITTGEFQRAMSSSLPLPYEDFRNEVLARVYERDTNKLLMILNGFGNYSEIPANIKNTHVLIPVRLPDKDVVGAVSKETIYGVNKNSKSSTCGCLTQKISVLKLTKESAEKIVDKDKGNKAVYDACIKWFDNKKTTQYPILQPKGNVIKYVKIVVAKNADGKVDLSNGRFAENINCIRTYIYKKKGDERTLYFVPAYYYQISRQSIRNRQIARGIVPNKAVSAPKMTVMWAQGNNGSEIISTDELRESYNLIGCTLRYSLVEIEKTDGSKGLAYAAGSSSGTFEVYSPLGDDSDLMASGLFKSVRERTTLTCSTIKNVKVRSITVLGKLN